MLLDDGMGAPEVARQLGISKTTIYRWLSDTAFQAHLATQRAALRAEIASTLHSKATAAVKTIADLMEDTSAPKLVRLKAAEAVLSRTIGDSNAQQLQEQIAYLEKLIEETHEYTGKGTH
jgi:predicted DNA-binding transcriptional regulator AlpA